MDLGRKMLKALLMTLLITVIVALALLYLLTASLFVGPVVEGALDGFMGQIHHMVGYTPSLSPEQRATHVRELAIFVCSILLAGPPAFYGLWRLCRFAGRRLGP